VGVVGLDLNASSTDFWQTIGTVLGYISMSAAVYIIKAAKDWWEDKQVGRTERTMNSNLKVYEHLTSVKLTFDADLVMFMQFRVGEFYNPAVNSQKIGLTHYVTRPGVSVPSAKALNSVVLSRLAKSTVDRILEAPHKVYTTKSMDESCLLREVFQAGGIDYQLLTTVRFKKDQILGALMICWLNKPEVALTEDLLSDLDEERQTIALALTSR